MLFHPPLAERLGRIADRLQSTDVMTAGLVSEIVSECCDRLPVSGQGRAAAHLRELILAGGLDRRGRDAHGNRAAAMEAAPPCVRRG